MLSQQFRSSLQINSYLLWTHTSSILRIQSRNATFPNRLGPVLGGISSTYLFNVSRTSPIAFIVSLKMMSSSRQVLPLMDSFSNRMKPTIRSNAVDTLNRVTSKSEFIFFSGTWNCESFLTLGNESKLVMMEGISR